MNIRSLLFVLFILTISFVSLIAQSGQLNQVRETNFQCDIVIDIYDGFVEWGATPFPKTWGGSLSKKDETKKYTEGAVFLANKNDTNGNGVIDWSDNNITANPLGRSEIDLVKIVIKPRDQGLNLTGQVVVSKVSGSNDIRFWTSPVKASGTQISLPHTTSVANLPLTLYMEAKEPSSTVRDIVSKLRLEDALTKSQLRQCG